VLANKWVLPCPPCPSLHSRSTCHFAVLCCTCLHPIVLLSFGPVVSCALFWVALLRPASMCPFAPHGALLHLRLFAALHCAFAALCCTLLHFAAHCCTVLYFAVLCCTLLYFAAHCCTLLYFAVLCCTLLYFAVHCCTLLYLALLHLALLYFAVLKIYTRCRWGNP
jgi:hypothetical protein